MTRPIRGFIALAAFASAVSISAGFSPASASAADCTGGIAGTSASETLTGTDGDDHINGAVG